MSKISESIREIKEDIKKYSSNPEKVRLVAVTKYSGTDEMVEAFEGEHFIVGENRVQLIKEKKEHFDETQYKEKIEWHFIGNLQKNKVKFIAEYVELIHSVNKLSLAKKIDKRAKQNNKIIDVLLEVNIAGEESKEGYLKEAMLEELPEILKLENIRCRGLMTMAPFITDEAEIRNNFKNLRELKDELNETHFNGELAELSMGMTNDYKIALEEGATIIRVGSKIFK